jgi:hypothetical protein
VSIEGESSTWVFDLGETLPSGTVIKVGKGGKLKLIHPGMRVEVSVGPEEEVVVSEDKITRNRACAAHYDKKPYTIDKQLPSPEVDLDLSPASRRVASAKDPQWHRFLPPLPVSP